MTADEALKRIPEGWFLHSLRHHHTPANYAGQVHEPRMWIAELQKTTGGCLTVASGADAASALEEVVAMAQRRERSTEHA